MIDIYRNIKIIDIKNKKYYKNAIKIIYPNFLSATNQWIMYCYINFRKAKYNISYQGIVASPSDSYYRLGYIIFIAFL